jgi:hypothetical protein
MARGQTRIEQLYAFVALDPRDNTEGIPASLDAGEQMWRPMVAADMKRVNVLRHEAQEIATITGVTVTLCRFEVRTELEVFEP